MRISIKTKIVAAFGTVILLSAATAGIAIKRPVGPEPEDRGPRQCPPRNGLGIARQIPATLYMIQREEKNFLLSSSNEDMDRFDKAMLGRRDDLKMLVEQYRRIADSEGVRKGDATRWHDRGNSPSRRTRSRTTGRVHSNAKGADLTTGAGTEAASTALDTLRPLLDRVESGGLAATPEQISIAHQIRRMTTDWAQIRLTIRNALLVSDDASTAAALKPLPDLIQKVNQQQDQIRKSLVTDEDIRAFSSFMEKISVHIPNTMTKWFHWPFKTPR